MGSRTRKVPDRKAAAEQQPVSFRRLVRQALPEMWGFQIIASACLSVLVSIIVTAANTVAQAGGGAISTAGLQPVLFSWKMPVLLLLGIVLVLCYIVIELFAKIHLCDDILFGRKVGVLQELGKGIRSLRRFMNPTGLLVLLYIFIGAPLCGVGFSIGLTRTYHIPSFIMAAIDATPLYVGAYLAVMVFLVFVGFTSAFILHAVLIDGMTPAEGRRQSMRLIRKHLKQFVFGLVKVFATIALIQALAYLVLFSLPEICLEALGAGLQGASSLGPAVAPGSEMPVPDDLVVYRILCVFAILAASYLTSTVLLLCDAYFMLRFTGFYLSFSEQEPAQWLERPKKSRLFWKLLLIIGVLSAIVPLSITLGINYDELFLRDEPVKIVAHRAGGNLELENTLAGLDAAIDHDCYASETDIQRTKDGHYIINHDADFGRLTGVAKKPQDMTIDEVRELRITDPTGAHEDEPVATLEEMLDTIKGKETLFIELKGVTADRQMADDTVRIVRQKDCVDEVALISLNYDVIDYAETTYPEFQTGTLFFAGLGDVSRLNCDLLIMEEEAATDTRIYQIHDAGKWAIAWTVNDEESMRHFLDSDVDAVITDEIELAEQVQAQLDERTTYEIIRDTFIGYVDGW